MPPFRARLLVGPGLLISLNGLEAVLLGSGRVPPSAPVCIGFLAATVAIAGWTWFDGQRHLDATPRSEEPGADDYPGEAPLSAGHVPGGHGETGSGSHDLTQARQLLDQASRMIRQSATQTRQANELAEHACETANRGVTELAAIGDAITALNESSEKVAQILKTIDRVAFETNILALNAAIEAARAGTAGAGFSVVADEVRRLAHSTADAARETSSQIEETVSWIAQIDMLKAEVVNTLNEIADKSRELAQMVSVVTDASSREAATIEELSATMTSLDDAPAAASLSVTRPARVPVMSGLPRAS